MLWAFLITALIESTGRTCAFWSKAMVAKPNVPSSEMRLPAFGSNGLVTPTTCGSFATAASIGAIFACTSGSVSLPVFVWKTI